MNIVSPISKIEEVESVIKAGANEIYCGVFTSDEKKEYTNLGCLNRRATALASLKCFKELKTVVEIAHFHNIRVSFTINEIYSEKQLLSALTQVDKAVEAGVDVLIIADVGLLYALKKRGLKGVKRHISSTCSVLNSETVDFYRDLGASRIILPRQLTLDEISGISQRCANIELEVCILNKKCRYAEGFCTLQHGLAEASGVFGSRWQNSGILKKIAKFLPQRITNICRRSFLKQEFDCYSIYNSLVSAKPPASKKSGAHTGYSACKINPEIDLDSILNVNGCAACAVFDLAKLGIGFFKIIGRSNLHAKKVTDVGFIKSSIELLKENKTKIDFEQGIKRLYEKIYFSACNPQYCYYSAKKD